MKRRFQYAFLYVFYMSIFLFVTENARWNPNTFSERNVEALLEYRIMWRVIENVLVSHSSDPTVTMWIFDAIVNPITATLLFHTYSKNGFSYFESILGGFIFLFLRFVAEMGFGYYYMFKDAWTYLMVAVAQELILSNRMKAFSIFMIYAILVKETLMVMLVFAYFRDGVDEKTKLRDFFAWSRIKKYAAISSPSLSALMGWRLYVNYAFGYSYNPFDWGSFNPIIFNALYTWRGFDRYDYGLFHTIWHVGIAYHIIWITAFLGFLSMWREKSVDRYSYLFVFLFIISTTLAFGKICEGNKLGVMYFIMIPPTLLYLRKMNEEKSSSENG